MSKELKPKEKEYKYSNGEWRDFVAYAEHLGRWCKQLESKLKEADEQNKELRDGVKSVQISILEMEQSSSIDSNQILYELEALNQKP